MLAGPKGILYCCLLLTLLAFVPIYGQRFDPFSTRSFFDDEGFSRENIHFIGPPTDRFWQQFWDTFNYKGPLQENPFYRPLSRPVLRPVERPGRVTTPYFPDYGYEEQQYSGQDYFFPRRQTVTPVRQDVGSDDEDEYDRYKNYFYRRYGTNFVD